MLKYLILFLAALMTSLLLTPLVRFASRRLGALDLPGERKIHDKPIPRLGGLSIFIVFSLVVLVTSQIGFFFFPLHFLNKIHFLWILAASAIVLGLGTIDDFRRMTPGVKFFFQIIAGVIVALTCYRIEVISLPFFGTLKLGIWSVPATVFWVVAITNAINLLDGLDGLAGGTSFIVCMAMFAISLLNQNVGIALLCIILSGGILGFLKYNFHPASIFLGDSGAYFLGFIISVFSLLSSLKGTTTIAILIPIIALGLPIMDTLLSMFRRILKSLHIMEIDPEKNVVKFFYLDGWSMFKADREHIHHRLLEMGFTYKKAVLVLYGVSLILGGVALFSIYFKNINYAILLAGIGIASYIGIRKLGYREILPKPKPREGTGMALNPIKALMDAFEKLIIEHGSAVIQEKQIALFKDQLMIADRENAKLITEMEKLQSKLQDFQTEFQSLQMRYEQFKKENEQLKGKVQSYEQPNHGTLLDQPRLDILKLLFKKDKLVTEQIARELNLEIETAKFHLEELRTQNMVKYAFFRMSTQKPAMGWSIEQEGRRYLIGNKLI